MVRGSTRPGRLATSWLATARGTSLATSHIPDQPTREHCLSLISLYILVYVLVSLCPCVLEPAFRTSGQPQRRFQTLIELLLHGRRESSKYLCNSVRVHGREYQAGDDGIADQARSPSFGRARVDE